MYVFWWSGRGYLTVVIVLATLAAFGVILQAAASAIEVRSWMWGVGLLLAAALNWHFGGHVNRKKLASLRPRNVRERLFYRARHRFMSLPMETFSIVIVLVGAGVIVRGLIAAN